MAVAERFAAQGNTQARIGSDLERSALVVTGGDERGHFVLSGPGLVEALQSPESPASRFSTSLRELVSRIEGSKLPSAGFYASRTSIAEITVTLFGETYRLACPRHAAREGLDVASASGEVRAPMAGKVVEVRSREGEQVEEGQVVFVIESMKMQLEVRSPARGRVSKIHVSLGEVLAGPDVLATLE